MKCNHCGSAWTSTQSTTVCPFCGKSLTPATDSPKTMVEVLTQIRNISGTAAFANGKALLSCFKDLAPDLKKEQTLLAYLEKCGGMAELYAVREKSPTEQNVTIARVVCRMSDELLINETAARSVCTNYLHALCGKAPVDTAQTEADEAARKKAETAAKRKATLEAKKKAQEEAAKKAQEEAAKKKADLMAQLNAQQEAQRKAEEAKRKAEAEARKKATQVNTNRSDASVTKVANSAGTTKFTDIMRMFFIPSWVIAAVLVVAATEGFGDDISIFLVPVFIFLMVLGGIALVNKGSTFVGGTTIFGAAVIAASFVAIGLEVSDDETSFVIFLALLVFCCTASAISIALPKNGR